MELKKKFTFRDRGGNEYTCFAGHVFIFYVEPIDGRARNHIGDVEKVDDGIMFTKKYSESVNNYWFDKNIYEKVDVVRVITKEKIYKLNTKDYPTPDAMIVNNLQLVVLPKSEFKEIG